MSINKNLRNLCNFAMFKQWLDNWRNLDKRSWLGSHVYRKEKSAAAATKPVMENKY